MKQKKFILLFSFLLTVITISSCKKDEKNNPLPTKVDLADKIKSSKKDANGVATNPTKNAEHFNKNVLLQSLKSGISTSNISTTGDTATITRTIALPFPYLGNNPVKGHSTNLLPGGGGGNSAFEPVIAVIVTHNGVSTLTLKNNSQTVNGVRQTATAFDIHSFNGGISFSVVYIQTEDGVTVGSAVESYTEYV